MVKYQKIMSLIADFDEGNGKCWDFLAQFRNDLPNSAKYFERDGI